MSHCEPSQLSHFWVTTGPLCFSSIAIPPALSVPSSIRPTLSASLKVYDPDGAICNELDMEFPADRVALVELAELMHACKMHAGLRHAHLTVETPRGVQPVCRLYGTDRAAISSRMLFISDRHTGFLPLTLAGARVSTIALLNTADTASRVVLRWISQTRSPEISCEIPAMGVRLVAVEEEFADFQERSKAKKTAATIERVYLRLRTRSTAPVGVQLVENQTTKTASYFSLLS